MWLRGIYLGYVVSGVRNGNTMVNHGEPLRLRFNFSMVKRICRV